jgi:inner membrane transporter RhtA
VAAKPLNVVTSRAGGPRPGVLVDRVPAPSLLVTGAVSQYAGSALAVSLFASVPVGGVAYLRLLLAGLVLVAVRRPWRAGWTRRTLATVVAFGVVLGLMNMCFYEAIARIPLGVAVAIEFVGPITMAALGSRTRRDALALLTAVAGVALLADLHLGGSGSGVLLALAAGVMWALYIGLGHRVANHRELRPGDGLAVGMLFGALLLSPWLAARAAPAFHSAGLLAEAVVVALASSAVPYGLEQAAMRRLPRARFALLLSLLPATAAVMGALLLAQIPSVPEVGGIALVVAASALRSHRPREP